MLLIIIALAAFSSTLAGGLLALGLRDKLHLILGFSAGAVIGVAFFDLLPESLALGSRFHGAGVLMSVTALGFLAYLVLDRILLFHGDSLPRGAVGAGVLCVHSLLDGVAVGLAFQASKSVGIIVAIAVLTHDFSDGINTMNIVLKNQGDRSRAMRWLLLDAAAPVAGIAATALFHLRARGIRGGSRAVRGLFSLHRRERSHPRELPRAPEASDHRHDAGRRGGPVCRRESRRLSRLAPPRLPELPSP